MKMYSLSLSLSLFEKPVLGKLQFEIKPYFKDFSRLLEVLETSLVLVILLVLLVLER